MGVGDDVAPRFTQKPTLKQENGGKKLVFLCVLEASPEPEIKWFLGTTPLNPSDKLKMRLEPKGGPTYNVIMDLFNVSKDDAGTYKVVAKNKLGEVSATINLNLGGAQNQQEGLAPNFTTKPATRQVGKNLVMECQLSADPKPTIEWFRDDTKLAPGGNITMSMDPKGPKAYALMLEIKNVGNADAGAYKIVAKNDLGESNATIKLNFDSMGAEAKGKPMFTSKPAIRQLGEKLIIECKLTADPKPDITWQLNNKTVSQNQRIKMQIRSLGKSHTISLEINKVGSADGGEYKAIAKNTAGESTATINLNFEGKQTEAGKAPHFTQKPIIKQPQKNQLTMTCNLESSSQPVIKWFREATEIKQGGRYTIQTTKDPKGPNMYIIVLTIKDPAPADGGVYKCVASNENGESNANITLNFQDTEKTEPAGKAPNFKDKPKITQEAGGKNIHIECNCTADPKPTIIWYKGSTVLKESSRLKLKTTQDKENYSFMLDIVNFTKDDAGVYKVVAKNAHGEGTANITLNLDAQEKDKDKDKDAEKDKDKDKDKEKKTITLKDKPTTTIELDKKRVIFEQKIESKDKPTAQWFFGNSPLKTGGRYKMDMSQKESSYAASMQIDEITTKDAGPYKCVLQTPFGEAVQLMKLSSTQLIPPKVKGDPPKFITKLTSKTFTIGEAMDITLKVAGTEPITTAWFFADKEIKTSTSVNISYERGTARFYMSKVTPKDAGVYTVELKNPVGSVTGSAKMIVKEDEKKKQKEEEMQRKEEERKKEEERQKIEMEEREKKKKEDDKKKEEEKKKTDLKKKEDEKKKAEEDKKKKEVDDKKKKEDEEKKKKEDEEKKKKEEEEKKKKEEEEKKKKEEDAKKKEEEEKKKKEKAAAKGEKV